MRTIRSPFQLADAVEEDDYPERLQWLAQLPAVVDEIASGWELELGDPYLPSGQCAWVAPAHKPAGDALVLKVGWRQARPSTRPTRCCSSGVRPGISSASCPSTGRTR